jgi:acyl-CoA synthetase (NDP forming)
MTTDLKRLFEPRSIAVLGASTSLDKLGGQVFRHLAASFAGELFAVNPTETEIEGRPSVPALADLPCAVDLVVALLPGAALVKAIDDCPVGRAAFLVAIPSGFGEVKQDGPALQNRLAEAARRAGMRVVGPNCVGILNPAAGMNASIIPLTPPGGSPGVAIATQSGGFGMATAMYASDTGLAVAAFCDVGNTVDVSIADCLRHYADSSAIGVIGLYVESVRDPADFAAALREAALRKPVVLCPLGRSPAGQMASLAHVGIATNSTGLARVAETGVVIVDTGLDLLHAATALLWQAPSRAGRRLAIVTGTGGIGTEIADLASERGLVVNRFSDRLIASIARHLPEYASSANPVDLTPVWRDYPRLYPLIIEEIARSGEADLVAVSITDVPTMWPDLAVALARELPRAGLPIGVYWASRDADIVNMAPLREARIPCFRTTRDLALALDALARSGLAKAG